MGEAMTRTTRERYEQTMRRLGVMLREGMISTVGFCRLAAAAKLALRQANGGRLPPRDAPHDPTAAARAMRRRRGGRRG